VFRMVSYKIRGVKHATAFARAYEIGGAVDEVAMEERTEWVTEAVVRGAMGSLM
jgi:hypothetical protein